MCAILALSAPWIAEFYAVDELTLLIQGSSLYFLVIGFKNLHLVRLTRAMKFSKPKLISSVSMMTGVVVTILTGLWTRSIWCVIWGGLSHRFVEVVGSHIFAPSGLKLSFNKADFMELFRYGRNIQAIGILVFLVTQFDNAVIGKLLSMGELAVYANAYLLANLPMTQIVGVASQVAFPAWSKVTREGTVQERNTMFLSTLRLTTALSVALCLALFVGGADLIELIFGAKWRDAETPLRILLIFGLWRGIGTNFGSLFNALGKPHIITIEIGIKFLCIALLIYPLTAAYGIIGASLAVVLPMGLITPIALWIYLGMADVDRRAALHCLWLPAVLGTLIIVVWWWASASGAMPQSVWIRGLALPIVALFACAGGCVLFDSKLRRVIGFRSAKINP
ncbi:MAG: oligosaccharide flippase family protein [Myxococcota bacterium]|nr:oligosaccharide flippase family protein [Myxococcota bacterium]